MYVLLDADGAPARWPYTLDDLRIDRPDIELSDSPTDDELAALNVFALHAGDPPQAGITRIVHAVPPELTDGKWQEAYRVEERPIEEARASLLAELASVRYQRETGGITIKGMGFKTDRETQAILTGAFVMASANPAFSILWKSGPGVHVPIDAQTIMAAGSAATAHVQACFAHEAELAGDILAATDLDAIDINAGWPE